MFYLVDLENVKNDGLLGMETLSEEDFLIIFYSKNANSISIDNHMKLELAKAKKEYIETKISTNNALDFQLVTYLGFLIAKYPDSSFAIISKDRGYEAVTQFWKNKKINITILYDLRHAQPTPLPKNDAILPNKTQPQNSKTLNKDLEALLPTHKDKITFIKSTIEKYKTKQGVNNALVKKYKSETAGVIYKAIKPLIKDKKGRE